MKTLRTTAAALSLAAAAALAGSAFAQSTLPQTSPADPQSSVTTPAPTNDALPPADSATTLPSTEASPPASSATDLGSPTSATAPASDEQAAPAATEKKSKKHKGHAEEPASPN